MARALAINAYTVMAEVRVVLLMGPFGPELRVTCAGEDGVPRSMRRIVKLEQIGLVADELGVQGARLLCAGLGPGMIAEAAAG